MDIQLAKAIISEQFPELVLDEVTEISEGGDSYTFDLNGSVIFKFPISDESSNRLVREYHAPQFLTERLPGFVSQPLYLGQPSSSFPYPFTGQRKLEGESGEKCKPDPRDWSEIAEEAGQIVSRLHANPTNGLAHLNLRSMLLEKPRDKLDQVLFYKDLLQNRKFPYGMIPYYLNDQIQIPSVSPLTPVLSIKGEHILVDNHAYKIKGIVDWADICLADPSVDFSGFVLWLGPVFVRHMLNNYQLEVDEEFLDRVVFYARCNTLIHLGESLAGTSDAPYELLLAQLRAAFQAEHGKVTK